MLLTVLSESALLIRVPAAELPPRAQALLDPTIPRPADSRLQVRRTQLSWIPALWLAGLVAVGLASVLAMTSTGPGSVDATDRTLYGVIGLVCFLFAAVSAHRLILGLAERRAVRGERYRWGLHLLGEEGLLIAGRADHTWVPRSLLPAPATVSSRGGGASVASYRYTLADGSGRTERLDCGVRTQAALRAWAESGELPQGDGWLS